MFKRLLKVLKTCFSLNEVGTVGQHIRYGQIKGKQVNVGGLVWAATQAVKNQSGKFVYVDDGALKLCDADTDPVFGWVNEYERTPGEGDIVTVNIAWDAVYRIPIATGTFVIGMIGDSCDIDRTTHTLHGTNTQGAILNVTVAEALLLIVGGDVDNNKYVDVRMNPNTLDAVAGVLD